jgi:hypothetical protein
MSARAPAFPDPRDLAKYRALKAKALMLTLASQCRTPLEAARFLFKQLNTPELRATKRLSPA